MTHNGSLQKFWNQGGFFLFFFLPIRPCKCSHGFVDCESYQSVAHAVLYSCTTYSHPPSKLTPAHEPFILMPHVSRGMQKKYVLRWGKLPSTLSQRLYKNGLSEDRKWRTQVPYKLIAIIQWFSTITCFELGTFVPSCNLFFHCLYPSREMWALLKSCEPAALVRI